MKLECFWGEGLGRRVRWWCVEAWGDRAVLGWWTLGRGRVWSLESEEQKKGYIIGGGGVVQVEDGTENRMYAD